MLIITTIPLCLELEEPSLAEGNFDNSPADIQGPLHRNGPVIDSIDMTRHFSRRSPRKGIRQRPGTGLTPHAPPLPADRATTGSGLDDWDRWAQSHDRNQGNVGLQPILMALPLFT
jgi:hypothetical protein